MPETYLDMPLGARNRSKSIWSVVIGKCERKLTSWKGQYLSKGGMINSVLPTYMTSVFPSPAWLVQRMDTIKISTTL